MSKSPLLLLVDDCAEDRVLYRRFLQQECHSYQFLEADCGEAALKLFQQFQPDVMLLDYLLPDMDGIEFLERLQQQVEDASQTAVIMLTGQGNERVAVQAIKGGVEDYLVKSSLTAELLCHTVRKLIEQSQLKQQLVRQQLELQRERTFNSAIMGAINALVIVLNCQGQIIRFNPACEQLTGYQFSEVQGRCFWDFLLVPEEVELVKGAFAQLKSRQEQTASQYENDWVAKDGTHYRIIWSNTILCDANGQIEYVIGTGIDISDRKHSENALHQLNQQLEASVKDSTAQLQESEAELQAIIRQAGIGITQVNLEGRFLKANQKFCALLGYTEAELLPKTFMEITALEDLQDDLMQNAKLMAGEIDSFTLEKRLMHKDGTPIWTNITVSAVRDPSGEPVYTIGITEDIRDRKQAEANLRESEEKLRLFVEHAPAAVAMLDREMRYLAVSRRWLSDYGCGDRNIISQSHYEVFAEIPQHWQQIHQRCLAGAVVVCEEDSFQRSDGKLEWLRWEIRPWHNSHGEVGGIIMLTEVITARKLAQDALQQQMEREHFLTTVMQQIRKTLDLTSILQSIATQTRHFLRLDRVMIYRFLSDGTRVAVPEVVSTDQQESLNSAFPTLTLSIECYWYFLQEHVYTIANLTPNDSLLCLGELLNSLKITAILTVPIIQQNTLWGLLIAHQRDTAREWQTGEVQLMQQLAEQLAIAIHQSDLYKQLQLELNVRRQAQDQLLETNQQLLITNAELARATRLKDEFLANMSHELRTPLNAILGLSECLLDNGTDRLSDRQRKAITTIEKSGQHLLALINDILDLAKVEANKLELCLSTVKIGNLCEASISFVRQAAIEKQIDIKLEIGAGVDQVEADERRLQQILINLLSNAVKFTPERGQVILRAKLERSLNVKPKNITTKISSLDAPALAEVRQLVFEVEDTGIGIAPDDISKLFQSFVQIDSKLSRLYAGTGLGLALVKRLVHLHGGEIAVESEPDKGSCFTVRLPYQEKSSPHPSLAPDLLPAHATPSPPSQPTILLVEDNEDNIETFSSYLLAQGYQIIIARNGAEAVFQAKNALPDLILMDIQIPGIDGLEAICRIRAQNHLSQVPIIALTALAMAGDREKCLAAGANDYLAKPISLRQLTNLIKHYLQLNSNLSGQ